MLSRGRPTVSTGMSAVYGAISYADKAAYAKDHELADTMDDLDDFLALIGAMDEEFLKLNTPKKPAKVR